MIPMSRKQRNRADELVREAQEAMNRLAEERLNLDPENRAQLNHVRGAMDDFDYGLRSQPVQESV